MRALIAPAIGLGIWALMAPAWSVTVRAELPNDWSTIPTTTLKLFYPGQASYDWLRSSSHKRAYKKVLEGAELESVLDLRAMTELGRGRR